MASGDDLQIRPCRNQAFQAAVEYGIDGCLLDYALTLSPRERLTRHDQALEVVLAVRQAGIQYYGFDPRLPKNPERQ